jgi:hypothetical protein
MYMYRRRRTTDDDDELSTLLEPESEECCLLACKALQYQLEQLRPLSLHTRVHGPPKKRNRVYHDEHHDADDEDDDDDDDTDGDNDDDDDLEDDFEDDFTHHLPTTRHQGLTHLACEDNHEQ